MLNIISQYRLRLFTASLLIFISNLLLIINPLIFRQALIALVLNEPIQNNSLNSFFHTILGSYFQSAWAWGLLLLAIAIISALFRYKMRLLFFSVSREVELDIREKLFERIQAQSRTFFDHHKIGELLSRLTNDITAYRDMLGPGFMYPMHFLTLVIPALIALFYISPLMGIISFIPIVAIYVLNFVVRKPLLHVSQKVQRSLSDMSVMVHEHFSGIKLIKSYGIEQAASKLFKGLCEEFSKINMRFASLQGMLLPSLTILTKIVSIILLAMSAAIILLNWGNHPLDVADFLSFMWIQSYIFNPLLMLAWVMPMYQKGQAAYLRLVEIYDEPIEIQDTPETLQHIPNHANIEFRDLNFSYSAQDKPIFSHFNLSIKGGTFVGITGPVGGGKTTLLRLLSREYEVPQSSILIGEHDIHQYSLHAFRRAIVTVEQLPFLFSKSILDNIKFGKQDATFDEVESVARLANLHDDILEFPNQYETVVGERGVSLSGGQKQRVAIARAFMVNRSILLMDDIFSALDTKTEKKIFQTLKSNFKGKTVLLVTHRISILEQLDRVIYIQNGHVIEDGTPEELNRKPGPYKTLVDIQKNEKL